MSAAPAAPLPEAVRALAEGDFGTVAQRFAQAGFEVALPAPGIFTVRSSTRDASRPSVLVSVGVHGDETGPIEMTAHVVEALSRAPQSLAVQRAFFEKHIAPWYASCLEDIRGAEGANFYRRVADFIQAFVEAEAQAFELDDVPDAACELQ